MRGEDTYEHLVFTLFFTLETCQKWENSLYLKIRHRHKISHLTYPKSKHLHISLQITEDGTSLLFQNSMQIERLPGRYLLQNQHHNNYRQKTRLLDKLKMLPILNDCTIEPM